MKQEQALQILINAAIVAQRKGAFELQEAKLVAEAVEVFTKKPEPENKKVEEETKPEVEVLKEE